MKNTATANLALQVETQKDGIVILKNEETGIHHFTLDDSERKIISCPDGKSAFDKIEIHSHIVICQLPWWRNGEPTDGKWRKIFRIYLKDEKEWLINPCVIDDETLPLMDEEKGNLYNFFRVLSSGEHFIHLKCEKGSFENQNPQEDRVYCTKDCSWICVYDYGPSMEAKFLVGHFKEVKDVGVEYSPDECLLLTTADDRKCLYSLNPIIREEVWQSVPTPDEHGKKERIFLFHAIFKNYLVIKLGIGRESWYYVWKKYKPGFYSSKLNSKERLYLDTVFTEKYMAVRWSISSDLNDPFKVISTETWQSIEIQSEISISMVQFPKIDESGNLSVELCVPSLRVVVHEKQKTENVK